MRNTKRIIGASAMALAPAMLVAIPYLHMATVNVSRYWTTRTAASLDIPHGYHYDAFTVGVVLGTWMLCATGVLLYGFSTILDDNLERSKHKV